MASVDLYLFLSSYALTVAVFAVAEFVRYREKRFLLPLLAALAVIPAHVVVGSYVDPDKTHYAVLEYLVVHRDFSSVVAILMGAAAAYSWRGRLVLRRDSAGHAFVRAWEPLLLALSILLVAVCGQAYLWKDILGVTRHAVAVAGGNAFEIDKIADLDQEPLRITVGEDGSLFVCHDYFKKHGAWGGAILRFQPHPDEDAYDSRIVVEAPYLARSYGILARDGDLFVSRAGFFPQAESGKVSYASTGAVTRLKDLDADGYFEYADDIITGLPGLRAPDTMQQNNGMVFLPDGSLVVTSAGAADRTLDEHPYGGTLLKYSPDFQEVEILARGFRNPWAVALGPDGELFATDSDVDSNPGDELNHIIAGEHYGHPFIIPGEPNVEAVGFREPIFVAERESVLLGMVYVTSEAYPEEFRNCLYVTDFRRDRVLRMKLRRQGDTYEVTDVIPFARIPTPVDIAMNEAGELFVISRRASKLYRIRPKSLVPR